MSGKYMPSQEALKYFRKA